MKRWMTVLASLFLAGPLASGCGSKDPAAPPLPPSADRDGDGIPNGEDAFPDDPARFGRYAPVTLARLGGTFGAAVAINDANVAVGLSDDGTGSLKAVRWAVDGAPVALEPLPGGSHSAAYGIGEDGTVVGESEKATGTTVAVTWPAGTTAAAELGLGAFAAPAAAYGISGTRVVGEATNAGQPVAVVWTLAVDAPVPLTGLGGASSSAYFIRGDTVVGESTNAAGEGRAVLWKLDATGTPSGAPLELAPLDGHVASVALGVNTSGDVVGESEPASGEAHAVVWAAGASGVPGPPLDLGTGSASAVNDLERVAGHGGAPDQPSLWDLRNTSIADAILAGSSPGGQVYGMNGASVMVGTADGQGFAALPQ